VRIGSHVAQVIAAPGHTAGHILFHMGKDAVIFAGDTLFAMGCGRLFEGTAEQMYANMQHLATLPGETAVYCAHEYTQSNGRYARVAEPDNADIATRMREVAAARAAGEATVPTTIALERASNPFLRARDVQEFAKRRAEKDNFRG
jgi:hydroxyacylglutathione hydrolase